MEGTSDKARELGGLFEAAAVYETEN